MLPTSFQPAALLPEEAARRKPPGAVSPQGGKILSAGAPPGPHSAEHRCLPQARWTVDGRWRGQGVGFQVPEGQLDRRGRESEGTPNLPHPEARKGGALEGDSVEPWRWPCGLGGGWGGMGGHNSPILTTAPEPGSTALCSSLSHVPPTLGGTWRPHTPFLLGPAPGPPGPSSSSTQAHCAP